MDLLITIPAAAMRYTEARLSAIAVELLKDLDKDTVLMSLNFDDTEYEPTVITSGLSKFISKWFATGISAGYATDHFLHIILKKVIDATSVIELNTLTVLWKN